MENTGKSSVMLLAFLGLCSGGVFKRQALLRDVTTKDNCPSTWDAAPCVCRDVPGSVNAAVYCDNATNGADLHTAFARLTENAHFATFNMDGSDVTALTAGVFGKASFEFFFITNTKLATVDDNAFQGSEDTAENFLLRNNNFQNFNFKSLRILTNLKNFELSGDKLSAIPEEAFSQNTKVEVLNFNDNQVASIGQNAFANSPKLRTLDLAQNKLTALGDMSLATDANVGPVSVSLSHNQIASVHKDAFKNLNARNMEIEDNKLDALDADVFRPVVDSLNLSRGSLLTMGNPFSCTKTSSEWLVELSPELRSRVMGYTCRDGRALEQLTPTDLS